ncbi:hypothetical protein HDU80_010202 [Chytriomyces hyalinus]|nr:hypothetical protein HDU80_010202 [Chytriomyces hyalinus]
MQDPTPKITNPEAPISESSRGSADEVSPSKAKTATSDLEAPLLAETSLSRSTVPLDQDQDQVPDEQAETCEQIPTNPVAVTDQHPPVVDLVEAPQRRAPAPTTSAPTQNDTLDELVTGVESLQMQETEALQKTCEEITIDNAARIFRTLSDALYALGSKEDADWIFRNAVSVNRYAKLLTTALRLTHICQTCNLVREYEIKNGKPYFCPGREEEVHSNMCECKKDEGKEENGEGGNGGGGNGGGGNGGKPGSRSTSESTGQYQSQSPSSQNSRSTGSTPSSAANSPFSMNGLSLAGNEASEATNIKINPILNETQSGNMDSQTAGKGNKKSRRRKRKQGNKNAIEAVDGTSQPSDNPTSQVELPKNGKNVAKSEDSEDKLEVTTKIEVAVDNEQQSPFQVDRLVQKLSQVSVNNDVAPALTEVDNLSQEMSQVSLRDALIHTAATPQREAIKIPSATPSSPTSGRTWDLLLNHNNEKQGVTLYRNIKSPKFYIRKVKLENPNVECLEFPAGRIDRFLQTNDILSLASETSGGNPTWKDEGADFVWKQAEVFLMLSDAKLAANSTVNVPTPAANAPPPYSVAN